jgi:signal transduction histidine kinase/DNA-binding response OmpR family regulator
MLLPNICLSELVYFVPVVPNTVTIQVALTALNRSQCDRLIVLDSQQQPIGIVKLHRLLPQLMPSSETADSLPPLALPPVLTAPITAIAPSVIEPIILVPVEWQLSQLMMRVQLTDSEAIVLINSTGEILGLLDTAQVFQLLTENPLSPNQTEIGSPPYLPAFLSTELPHSTPHSASPDPQQRQIIQLTQQLLAQRAELEQRLKTQQDEINQLRQQTQSASSNPSPLRVQLEAIAAPPSQATLFHSLLELLERLPLPLMLQTQSGTVLAQNSTWRSQVGDLLDPGWIRQEASHLLGEPGTNPSLSEPNLCYVGTSPDSCVCLCPLKDGQERVLQFIKIPLCTLLPDWDLDWSNPSPQTAAAFLSPPSTSPVGSFRLADLTSDAKSFSPEASESSNANLSRYAGSQNTLIDEPWQTTLEIGTEALWLVQAQDVTEQQQLAHELTAKNADLIQLNRLKDEFLACISHELKTPLTAVLGLSSLLKDQTLGELNPRQVRYAQLIYQSSRHLMTVVNDILDLTRIETGQLQLLFAPVPIAAVCAQAFEQAKQLRLLESKSEDFPTDAQLTAQFSLEITPGLDIFVADELRLRQMLMHLLSNALKFTKPDKPIGLKVNRWGGWIAFTVWDQGIGIPAEKQHLIFQKFQQLENPLTRQFEGAGLGLVLTRRLARLHGGDVTFLSKEDEGSQFTVLLPPLPPNKAPFSYRDEVEDRDVPAESGEWLGGRSPIYLPQERFRADLQHGMSSSTRRDRLILIVEGVPQSIETLSAQLTGLGYRVVIARSGTEALEKARRLQPCIIFLNPLLPLLSGWDVLTLLKSNTETQHLPVVVMATTVEEAEAYRCHANGFMNLPIQTKLLEQTLKTLLIETQEPLFRDRPIANLTILRLYSDVPSDRGSTPLEDLNHLLQSHRYRILESDDLEQAELLARVWKPHVVLLEGSLSAPATYLEQLSHYPSLSTLPLVTLDSAVTQAASQIPGLLVFPYLGITATPLSKEAVEPATLLQVLQIAASSVWQPVILAMDISTLLVSADPVAAPIPAPLEAFPKSPKQVEWLQALTQYLQTAGLRSQIKQSWQEVMQQIQAQSVDLLLICWTSDPPESDAIALLSSLESLDPLPPILILDHRPHLASSPPDPLPDRITQLATQILVAPTNMTDLLQEIHWAMRKAPLGD